MLYNDKGISIGRGYYTPYHICKHTGAPKYIKQILIDIKGEVHNNTIIVGDVNTTLPLMDGSFK